MKQSIDQIDSYIAKNRFVQLTTDSQWKMIIDRILAEYGCELNYRCVGITQQPDPLRRFFTVFPDGVIVPYRHIKYLELLVAESASLDKLIDWLHSLGIPTQRVFEDGDDAGALRIFGYAMPE